MSFTATPMTWTGGITVTPANLNTEVRDALTGIAAAWTAFTPTLTASVTNPTGQTYTDSGYIQIGKTVHFRANILINGATTGSGNYSINLPVTPKAGIHQAVQGILVDNSNGYYPVTLLTGGSITAGLLTDPVSAAALL